MTVAVAEFTNDRTVPRARIAISVAFFIFGLAFAMWAVHIPAISNRLALDPATLGLALLNVGLGGVISQPITGWLIARSGSRPLATVMLLVFLATMITPIIAPSVPLFFVGTFVLGVTAGACNVAVNTQASEIERARGKPTMSSFHGFFSLGGLTGAGVGAGIIALGRQDGSGGASVAAVLFVIAAVVARGFLPSHPAPKPERRRRRGSFVLPTAAVLGLSALTFFGNTVEGAVTDWSALYLATERGLSTATAASGYAIFSLTMAVCRLAGGPVVARLGEQKVVLYGGILMAFGMALAVFSPWAFVSPFGFGIVAIGAANTIPVMMGAAARAPGSAPGTGIAATATAALLGLLIGPPLIGFMAHAWGLSVALALLSLSGVIVVVGAALYRWPPQAIPTR